MMRQIYRTVEELDIAVFYGCAQCIIHLPDGRCEHYISAPLYSSISRFVERSIDFLSSISLCFVDDKSCCCYYAAVSLFKVVAAFFMIKEPVGRIRHLIVNECRFQRILF